LFFVFLSAAVRNLPSFDEFVLKLRRHYILSLESVLLFGLARDKEPVLEILVGTGG